LVKAPEELFFNPYYNKKETLEFKDIKGPKKSSNGYQPN